jgi:hypothetical protein
LRVNLPKIVFEVTDLEKSLVETNADLLLVSK